MRLNSLPGRGTEDQIENLNIQDRRITNPPRRERLSQYPIILGHSRLENHLHEIQVLQYI